MPPPDPRDWLAAATAVLAPPACVSCRRPPARAGAPLLPACRAAPPRPRGPRCPRCALPAPCGARCPMAVGAIARAWSPLAFEGPARAVVHALKFRGAVGLADLMAAQIVATAPRGLLDAPGVALVPVPTPAGRPPPRGVDHAAPPARAVAAPTRGPPAHCPRPAGPPPPPARAPPPGPPPGGPRGAG